MDYSDVRANLGLDISKDLLSHSVHREDAVLISTGFNWKVVAPYLSLDEQQVSDIRIDSNCEQERRIKTLDTWMRVYGEKATYGRLIRALLESKNRRQALEIAVYLRKRYSTRSSDSSYENYLTPPETPPTKSKHTQTEDLDSKSMINLVTTALERRSNIYVPSPVRKKPEKCAKEKCAKRYLSTSSTQTHPEVLDPLPILQPTLPQLAGDTSSSHATISLSPSSSMSPSYSHSMLMSYPIRSQGQTSTPSQDHHSHVSSSSSSSLIHHHLTSGNDRSGPLLPPPPPPPLPPPRVVWYHQNHDRTLWLCGGLFILILLIFLGFLFLVVSVILGLHYGLR